MSHTSTERPYRHLSDVDLSMIYVHGPLDSDMPLVEHYRGLALEALIRLDTLKSKEPAPCPSTNATAATPPRASAPTQPTTRP